MKKTLQLSLLCCFICLLSLQGRAQEALKPRLSPLSMVTMKYEDTYIKITYSQPHKRGREIFGKLVPYGEVWRTGANEATEITITDDVEVNGKKLKAGTYSLFSIPGKDEWTIILNSGLGQWGAYDYDSSLDVLRFKVPAQKSEIEYEPFTITLNQDDKTTILAMHWDKTVVSFPIEF